MRNIVVLDAPSNLGSRPPAPGAVPGCYKLAGALREQRLVQRLGALEGGVVVPPRYDRADWREGDGVFHAAKLAVYTRRLADRIEHHVRAGDVLVVLGGDCSIQLGAALALRRVGRYGLAMLAASAGFRHPRNAPHPGNTGDLGRVGEAGGEELALATGRGQGDLTDLEGLRPYVRDEDIHLVGLRDAVGEQSEQSEHAELTALKIAKATVREVRQWGTDLVARAVTASLEADILGGFWVHFDADVLDPSVMPAVHGPDPEGLLPDELARLLGPLLTSPRCVGLTITDYDPDLDQDGSAGALLADLVAVAFAQP